MRPCREGRRRQLLGDEQPTDSDLEAYPVDRGCTIGADQPLTDVDLAQQRGHRLHIWTAASRTVKSSKLRVPPTEARRPRQAVGTCPSRVGTPHLPLASRAGADQRVGTAVGSRIRGQPRHGGGPAAAESHVGGILPRGWDARCSHIVIRTPSILGGFAFGTLFEYAVRFRLTPRETSFYPMFAQAADNIVAAAKLLDELFSQDVNGRSWSRR